VAARLRAWVAAGGRFVNYFGRQRFGSAEGGGAGTHDIGRAMLRGDWPLAARLILAPREGEPAESAAAKAAFARGDLAAALAAAPPFMRLERQLLRAMQASPGAGGAREAVLGVPPNLRHLYAYAYQSLLWNRLASERLRLLGDRPVEGDLVLAAAAPALLDGDDAEAEPMAAAAAAAGMEDGPEAEAEAHADDDAGAEGAASASSSSSSSSSSAAAPPLRPHSLPAVRVLTAADVAGGAYSIEHVLMPLPGFAVSFPQHAVGAAAAARLMAEDGFFGGGGGAAGGAGGGSDEERVAAAFSARDRRFQFAGGYRALVSAARDPQWRLLRGLAPHEDVNASDVELLRGGGGRAAARAAEAASASRGAPTLLVSFTLAKSAYATVALREVMEA